MSQMSRFNSVMAAILAGGVILGSAAWADDRDGGIVGGAIVPGSFPRDGRYISAPPPSPLVPAPPRPPAPPPTYSIPALPSPYPTPAFQSPPPPPPYPVAPAPASTNRFEPPSIQGSPTHPAYIAEPAMEKHAKQTHSGTASDSRVAMDPVLERRIRETERRIQGYQRQLDQILARHDNRWESLLKSPQDKRRCEEILRKWHQEERYLATSGWVTPTPMVPSKDAGATQTSAESGEELNASDLDN